MEGMVWEEERGCADGGRRARPDARDCRRGGDQKEVVVARSPRQCEERSRRRAARVVRRLRCVCSFCRVCTSCCLRCFCAFCCFCGVRGLVLHQRRRPWLYAGAAHPALRVRHGERDAAAGDPHGRAAGRARGQPRVPVVGAPRARDGVAKDCGASCCSESSSTRRLCLLSAR